MNNEDKILAILETMQTAMTKMQADMTTMQANMVSMETRLRGEMADMKAELRGEMADMKTELRGEIKASESRMMALMEAYFEPRFQALAGGHKLTVEQMVKKEEQEQKDEEIQGQLDVLKAVVRQHSREIEELKKAQ